MSFEYLDDLLGAIAAPFDKRIEDKGAEIEAALPPDKKLLVDHLDALHWDRSRAMTEAAYDTGVALGKQLGRLGPWPPQADDTRLCEHLAAATYRADAPSPDGKSAPFLRRGRAAPRRSPTRGAAGRAAGL